MTRSTTDLGARRGRAKQTVPGGISPVIKALQKTLDTGVQSTSQAGRLTISLNRNWRFCRLESDAESLAHSPSQNAAWEQVNLPHSVRLEPLNASGGRNFQGICWYRRNLEIPPVWNGKVLYLHFEGAMHLAEVWLNDKKIAANFCGYLPFVCDISSAIDFDGRNELLVRLDNRDNPDIPPGKPQKELDFTYFGGLYRNVRLEVIDPLHIVDPILEDKVGGGGVFVTFTDVSKEAATAQIRSEVSNEYSEPSDCRIVHELLDPQGELVGSASAQCTLAPRSQEVFHQILSLNRPQLWHPHHPHLYTLRTRVLRNEQLADEVSMRIGIRLFEMNCKSGLTINGEKFFSIGANRHQDHPYVGNSLPDSAHYRDVKKLREAGFTSVRSHYPQAPAFMDACDELGMLAIVSNPGWQFVGGKLFRERAVANARKMVRRDRNHPSVILWEAALNESDNRPVAESLHRVIHEELPGNRCVTAGDHEDGTSPWDVQYLNNDGTRPAWIREWGDQVDNWTDQQSRSRVRRAWGEAPMLIQAHSHAQRLDEILSGRSNHAQTNQVDRICGACLWAGIDCQRGYHHQPFYGGVLDLFRLPKFNYHFFRSQRPAGVQIAGLESGPMVFIANFATFLSPKTITVFTNCDAVRLTLDGKEIGLKRPDRGGSIPHPPITFEMECFAHEQSTMYMTGVAKVEQPPIDLVAEGIISGKVVATHRVSPPGVARSIALQLDLCGRDLIADGSDWVRVYAQVQDARGTICPMADDDVEFVVEADSEGDAKIIGSTEIAANPVRAEAGIATALLQAGTTPGKINLRASAFGLAAGRIQIVSVKSAS